MGIELDILRHILYIIIIIITIIIIKNQETQSGTSNNDHFLGACQSGRCWEMVGWSNFIFAEG